MVNTGLEGVVAAETEIGYVDGSNGHLIFRGHWAKDLAVRHSFEETANLLWFGRLPDEAELLAIQKRFAQQQRLTAEMRTLLDVLPQGMPMMSVLMAVSASLTQTDTAWPPTVEQAIRITALMPDVIAYRFRKQAGLDWNAEAEVVDPAEGHVARYLRLLYGHPANEAQVRSLSAYLVLAMEHGLNASTFTARVVSSTESDLFSSVGAAIGAMKGPLHGGAPSEVIRMLDEIGTKEKAEAYLRDKLERRELLMGFGHRVYKTRDPRAEALREAAEAVSGDDPWLDLARHVEETAIRLLNEYKPGRKLFANVEFYASAVMRAVNMPTELFTPTFTMARVVGWTSHVLEQSRGNRIYRPQSTYVGPMPADFEYVRPEGT